MQRTQNHNPAKENAKSYYPSTFAALECLYSAVDHYTELEMIMSEFEEIPSTDSEDIFEAAGIGWFQFNTTGQWTRVNSAMARMHGYQSPEEMLTWFAEEKPLICVEQEQIAQLLQLLQTYRIVKEFELQTCCKDGSTIWVLLTVKAIRSEQDNLFSYEGIAIDISGRKRAEAERMQLLACEQAARLKAENVERQFRELMDGLIDAIVWECDPDTLQFTFVSRSAERILGYPIKQWKTKPGFWVDILHPEDRAWVTAFCQQETQDGRDHEFEYRCLSIDGRVVWLRDRVTLIHNCHGRLQCLRGLMVDITERKQAEVERVQLLELERASNRAKDEFLATVSHELRTPLTNMRMAIQMLQVATQPQQHQRYLQILQSECTREIELINDLLDLQQFEAGMMQLNWVEVSFADWLPSIVKPFVERFAERQQSLQLDIASEVPVLTSDLAHLGRIVTELLNNACKYTPPGGEVTVAVRSLTSRTQFNDGLTVELVVQNSGVEIPPSELERIFDKFYRITSDDPWRQKGTGLGLALVAKLVEALGGTIRAESHTNRVSFIVTFGNSASLSCDRPFNSEISVEGSNYS